MIMVISLEVEVMVRRLFQIKDQKTRGQIYEYESQVTQLVCLIKAV